jgi:hypothetical protein
MEEMGQEEINGRRASNSENEGGMAFLISEKQENGFGQVNELKGK